MDDAEILDAKWADLPGVHYINSMLVTISSNGENITQIAHLRIVRNEYEWIFGDIILRNNHPLHSKLTERMVDTPKCDTSGMYFTGYDDDVETYAGITYFARYATLRRTINSWWICVDNCMVNAIHDELPAILSARENIITRGQAACERYCDERIHSTNLINDLTPVIKWYLMSMFPAILEPTHFVFGLTNTDAAADN